MSEGTDVTLAVKVLNSKRSSELNTEGSAQSLSWSSSWLRKSTCGSVSQVHSPSKTCRIGLGVFLSTLKTEQRMPLWVSGEDRVLEGRVQ